ncbi:histidine phosphatase family protein [Paenibacillus tundrae]|uniref:Broad specificity phosphatase PhoE n=1 Tax=Paenibacillus tundrae TaxID=528187 RepID=A0ABT9WES0_9BACL|nr:histidine phosphatase family protein [Paenibacillus tundrae]MDQ0171773.1 broad specificity phosphatase PhoE [Paenibacillus tundrae]
MEFSRNVRCSRSFAYAPLLHFYLHPIFSVLKTTLFEHVLNAIPIEKDQRLRERANWGDAPEQTFEQFVEMWNRCTREPDYTPPVGDSARQAGERLAHFLSELALSEPEQTTTDHYILVTHGGLITDFLVHTLPTQELHAWVPDFVAVQHTLIPECSITTLAYEQGQVMLKDLASVQHLHSDVREQE